VHVDGRVKGKGLDEEEIENHEGYLKRKLIFLKIMQYPNCH